jgi:hypothetical protein
MKDGVLTQLAWRPRDENALADALTNGAGVTGQNEFRANGMILISL